MVRINHHRALLSASRALLSASSSSRAVIFSSSSFGTTGASPLFSAVVFLGLILVGVDSVVFPASTTHHPSIICVFSVLPLTALLLICFALLLLRSFLCPALLLFRDLPPLLGQSQLFCSDLKPKSNVEERHTRLLRILGLDVRVLSLFLRLALGRWCFLLFRALLQFGVREGLRCCLPQA